MHEPYIQLNQNQNQNQNVESIKCISSPKAIICTETELDPIEEIKNQMQIDAFVVRLFDPRMITITVTSS